MKFDYNKEDDTLFIELGRSKISHAEQNGDFIVHFSKNNQAVLLEILEASKFIQKLVFTIPEKIKNEIFPPSPATS